MNLPVINIYRTTEEAFYFKNSQQNNFYIFTGVHLLPNNSSSYVQKTNTPNGISLEDWVVYAVDMCSGEKTNISASFMVEELTNSTNGDPQLFWSLTNVPVDFGYNLIYLEINQIFGETFYSSPFLLTNEESDKVTQFHYKDKRTDTYQSIGFQTWFRQKTRQEELTSYYETSTRNTVTQAVKVNKLEKHKSEMMDLDNLDLLCDVLISPYLYVNKVRCSLFESIKFPELTQQENFGMIDFTLSPNYNDIYKEATPSLGDFFNLDWDSNDWLVYGDYQRKFDSKFNNIFG